ncbi:MAG: Hsp20/alpha crystallin family protein [Myxococcaceae bacterium]
MEQLQDEVSRWFDNRLAFGKSGESFGWTPAVDIYEDTEGVTFKFDLPEIDAKDVQVHVENGVLTVRGERRMEREDKKDQYHRVERAYGAFTRSFSLPMTYDFDKIRAEQKNGVLRVQIPKRAEAKPKSIQVRVAS